MHRDLVERAMAGDREAFTELTRRSIGRLYAIARLILRDDGRAEDATQEALVAAWRQLSALRDPDRFDAWLRRMLVRACYREAGRDQRQRWTKARLLPVAGQSPDPGEALADQDELERAFARLTPEQRALVVLHSYLGLPMHETSEILGIPVGTVKSRSSTRSGTRWDAAVGSPAGPSPKGGFRCRHAHAWGPCPGSRSSSSRWGSWSH